MPEPTIPDAAVEAAVAAMCAMKWPDGEPYLKMRRSMVVELARAGLVAAYPHLMREIIEGFEAASAWHRDDADTDSARQTGLRTRQLGVALGFQLAAEDLRERFGVEPDPEPVAEWEEQFLLDQEIRDRLRRAIATAADPGGTA